MSSSTTITPPFRFSLLVASLRPLDPPTSVYRGSLPKALNLPFLATLNLKTIVSVTPKAVDVYEDEARALLEEKEAAAEKLGSPRKRRKASEVSFRDWATSEGINVIHVKVGSGKPKDGHIPFDPATVKAVLELMITRENLPMYIHDLDGSDVISIMGAALRKLQGWSEPAYTAEMSRFLRAPPPASEHRTFLLRLFSHTPHASDDHTVSLHIPPPSLRAPWLWHSGMPILSNPSKKNNTNSSSNGLSDRDSVLHATMRCRIAKDPDQVGDIGSNGSGNNVDERVLGRLGRSEASRLDVEGHRSLGSAQNPASGGLDALSRNSSAVGLKGDVRKESAPRIGVEEKEDEAEESEEEEDEDDDDEDILPISRMIDALDLGV
ncbi:hypothetical protein P7C70_g4743, partial [Phenoliferia sp. Uapishka_3]